VEIDPEFAMAYRSLAVAHSGLGHAADFRKYFKKALELSARLPENERLFIEAQSFFVDENYAKGIDILESLVKTYPGLYSGHLLLANFYSRIQEFDKAIEQEEIAIRLLRTPLAVGNLALFCAQKGLYQKSEDVCRSFLQDVEDNVYVRDALFSSYLCQRKFDLAFDEAEKLYLLDPQKHIRHKGIVLFLKDDFAGAEKILVDYGGQMSLLLARGKVNETVGLSRRNLEESKGNKEKEAGAYAGLAGALEKAGRYEDAYQALGQYLKLSAEYRKSAGESGLPYKPSQQNSDLFTKGRIQVETKSFDEARKTAEELKSLIAKGIDTKELRYYESILGLIELAKKNYRQAADFLGRACGRLGFEDQWNHTPASFFDNLARALYESGDLEKARQNYEKITQLTFGRLDHGDIYARAYYMLGKNAEQQGDKARARENYRKFLDLCKAADPGLPEVEDARQRLARLKGT
jgi:tetratricopeptide (TPR) repeat protein